MEKKTIFKLGGILAVAGMLAAVLSIGGSNNTSYVPEAGAAAVDYFLKIPGVEGESTDKGHQNEIDVMSWSWGITSPRDAASGLPTGKRQHKPLVITKHVDKASPELMLSCANGTHHEEVMLSIQNEQGQDYLRYSFFDVFCEVYLHSASDGAMPMEELSLNYGKVKIEYQPQDEKGKLQQVLSAMWDFMQDRGE